MVKRNAAHKTWIDAVTDADKVRFQQACLADLLKDLREAAKVALARQSGLIR
jgi:hypothetical protein